MTRVEPNKPLVSVVVPAYDVETFLSDCLESILSQTYRNWQCIVINDGSSDDSGGISDRFAQRDDRVKVIHQENQGVSAARNAGFESSAGAFVTFVDGDDWIHPNFLSTLVDVAQRHQADMVIGTRVMSGKSSADARKAKCQVWTSERAVATLLYPEIPLGVWNKLFRKDFLSASEIRFLDGYFMGEGLNFITHAASKAAKIVAVNHRLYWYRRDNAASATSTLSLEKLENALSAIDNVERTLKPGSRKIRHALVYHRWMTEFEMYSLLLAASRREVRLIAGRPTFARGRSLKVFLTSRISWRRRLRVLLILLNPPFVVDVDRWRRR